MRVVGVLDVAQGRAVHARGGRRDDYRPIAEAAGRAIAGDPVALAAAYVGGLGITELYVADLDAIAGRAPQRDITCSLAAQAAVWVDAGISSVDRATRAVEDGAARVIVGLETLTSFSALRDICAVVGGGRVAFSLDLRNGVPIAREPSPIGSEQPEALARRAIDAGTGAVIVLDLARVGSGSGIDTAMLTRVREAVPTAMLLTGGGIRNSDDLAALAALGCDGALVATALHDGRLTAAEIAAARGDAARR
jgi:phosphoribosylformimino-5-aminoimidazole carboxamide ribotide isomerase